MHIDGWARARVVFDQVVDLPIREREAALAKACAGNERLASDVQGLLAGDARGHTLEKWVRPAVLELLAPEAFLDEHADLGGGSAGPYRLLKQIGRGGMGTVFLAERADGTFERQVALKLVHHGVDSAEILGRFEAERRILASLDHPNIARLFDAGTAEDGRPFLVMEYVEGEPIDRYAAAKRLGLRRRLELFLQICRAVSHAHESLVVHRDLKPSNVLVSSDGEVKLLDFGIAKLADPLDGHATLTQLRPLTPEYASPEQLRGEVLSTSSDVYSLGVLLFELLTGQRPIRDGVSALARAFEAEPTSAPSPSSHVKGFRPEGGPALPEGLEKEPARLERAIRGDLDRITLKALDPDSRLRYRSVQALAEDVQRWLDGRPILARPPSFSYRANRFLRRNRWRVVGAGLAIAALLASTAIAISQARRAATERDTAIGVSAFLEDLLRTADPRDGVVQDSIRLSEFLDLAADRVRDGLADDPRTRARLLFVLGDTYRARSRVAESIPLLRAAIEANQALYGAGSRDEIQSRELLGASLSEAETLEAGLAQLDTALTMQLAAEGEEALLTWRLRERLGSLYARAQRNDEALPHLAATVVATRRAEPFDAGRLASSLNTYGGVLGQLDRNEEAVEALSEAASIFANELEGMELDEGVIRSNLSAVLRRLARWDESEREARLSHRLIAGRVGARHQMRARADIRLAEALAAQFQVSENPESQHEADSLFRAGLVLSGELPELSSTHFIRLSSFGRTLTSWGELDEAATVTLEALDAADRSVGPGHPIALAIASDLGRLEAELGQVEAGLARLRAAYAEIAQQVGPGVSTRLSAAQNLGRVLILEGAYPEAVEVLQSAQAAARESLVEGHPALRVFDELLIEAHAGLAGG